MTQQPSDYPVADPADEPDAGVFLEGSEEAVQPKGDAADVADQQLPPPGDDEDEALDLLADRAARSDGDRPV